MTSYWLGYYYLVLKRKYTVPGDTTLIDIGYRFNAKTVISFISTEDSGVTKAGINYLYKYPEKYSNVSITPVALPIITSNF